ncbi:MAG: PAS domain-containing protein, partial [Betaproteobacteria bacterium]|nr:PAS domain-containing protein [Betaproteobacteria bacterium]
LEERALDPEVERDVQLALEEIETMWEELAGQAQLLELEHARYRDFFEHAPDAYAVTDEGCNVREANLAFAELLGVVRADLLGKPLARFVTEPERVALLSNLMGAAENARKPLTWRSRLLSPSGKSIEGIFSVRAIPLQKSGVAGLCWLFRAD